jgi:catechol 2,3-dioxygenase-like lactoylglutathione lyase family enzyme
MKPSAKSIRPFIGAKNFEISRNFYQDLGFEEKRLTPVFSVFHLSGISFYLQDAYVKEWVENSQVFVELEDVSHFWNELLTSGLADKYEHVRFIPIRDQDWGRECFVHDPSGILWHFGQFFPQDGAAT